LITKTFMPRLPEIPIVTGLGFDPIWFGVVIVMTVELGLTRGAGRVHDDSSGLGPVKVSIARSARACYASRAWRSSQWHLTKSNSRQSLTMIHRLPSICRSSV
jgi:hypothetical protein